MTESSNSSVNVTELTLFFKSFIGPEIYAENGTKLLCKFLKLTSRLTNVSTLIIVL